MMFIDPSEDLSDMEIAGWYYNKLMTIARYPISSKTFISYGHCVEWKPGWGEEMVSAFIEMPQIIEDVGILHCKLGIMKTVICLQAILLNRAETDFLLQIGPQQFSNFLYPPQGERHFLCERYRSSKF